MKETYRKRGSRWYKIGNSKHTYDRRTCYCGKRFSARVGQPGLYCSKRCMQLGEHNTVWKGENAGYMALHGRVYRELGQAKSCPWGCDGPYEWSHSLGTQGNVDEYFSMCVPCHRKFDQAIAKCFDKTCKRGHVLNNETMYVKIRDGQEVRQCKQCAKYRASERRRASLQSRCVRPESGG